ncbi:fumarylacetoacetate hydrolase family protein [Cordyceps militaris CM01]|uniref:Fumarylacetoacetate hydrolase family protein n=1 Tax=Cordyceps militaris (strain CM01) TaxID=983644 RepID=G3JBV2_CORMM|nr:fumarylacetoacetate hydrolase family protein [Cordyceps militaris CM01]EGX94525.1 fumarylacetoacetate hydrolase family protein [Cordyceps militaris CM01]
MATASFSRLIRFVPCSNPASVMIGEPDPGVDIGHELREGRDVYVSPWSGSSVLEPGARSSRRELVQRVLSPLASNEVGTIRCIGLNYVQHAREIDAEIPTVPTVFLKPSTSLADPWPAPTILPAITQRDDSGDYEAELAIIIGKECKNVPENEALEYVLGYTACNDISSRASQFAQSQWCYSKGFDGSCPLALIPDPSKLRIRGLKNKLVMQDCTTDDLIFSVPTLVSFLSQGTTLPAGTVIITGTPAGIGAARTPKVSIREGDEFAVEILPHIGTLYNVFENEK